MIAFVPCSNKKVRDFSVPAWLMYLPSPSFQKVYADAKRRSKKVFIISGKYGLLDPETIIEPYDAMLKNASPEFLNSLRLDVEAAWNEHGNGAPALSYCGKEYERALSNIPFTSVLSGGMFERFGDLEKSAGPAKGSTLPIIRVVAWAYLNSGCKLEDLAAWIATQYENKTTRKCQFDRILNSGFFGVEEGRLQYIGHPVDRSRK